MKIHKHLLLYLILGFIVSTIVGTLSHEFGHYSVAKLFGYDARMSYATTWWGKYYPEQIINRFDGYYITLGGPMQTMLTGTIGFIVLCINRKSFQIAQKLSFKQWFFIFLALFWLRQIVIFAIQVAKLLFATKYRSYADEVKLTYYLHLPIWTITTFTALIGMVIFALVIFKFIPQQQRITFILAGLIGGVSGYVLWLKILGPTILPCS